MTKNEFLKLAKKRRIKIIKHDTSKAKPLSEIRGNLTYKGNTEDMLSFIRQNWLEITGY